MIVVIGGVVVDVTIRAQKGVDAKAMHGTSTPAAYTARSVGGVGRNFAEAYARLGRTVRVHSIIGEDAEGHFASDFLSRLGSELSGRLVSRLDVVRGARTAQYLAVLGADGELAAGLALMNIFDDKMTSTWAVAALRQSPAPRCVYLDGNVPCAAVEAVLKAARDTATWIGVDPISRVKAARMWPALVAANNDDSSGTTADRPSIVLKPNSHELAVFAALAGVPDAAAATVDAQLRAVFAALSRICAVIVTTLGSKGAAVIYRSGSAAVVRHSPAPVLRAPIVKVTGAGDTFFACFMHSLSTAAPSLDAAVDRGLMWGAAGAAMALTHDDGTTVIPKALSSIVLTPPRSKLW